MLFRNMFLEKHLWFVFFFLVSFLSVHFSVHFSVRFSVRFSCNSVLRQSPETFPSTFSCAAMNGIPPEITDRAETLARLTARGEDLLYACAVMS